MLKLAPFLPTPTDMTTGEQLDDIGWGEFHHALQALIHASCCGAGLSGALVAGPAAKLPAFAKIGHAAWRRGVKAASALLPMVSGSIVLLGVTIVEPERPARRSGDPRARAAVGS